MKPGYKRTDVGVIPEDWDVSTVGREFEIKLGKMLDEEKNVGVPAGCLPRLLLQLRLLVANPAQFGDRIGPGHFQACP